MEGIYYLVPTLIAIGVSMLIVRAGAIALTMTGMDFEKAKFQSLSAFSGTGFTTQEAERVVNNPRRRRIVTWLMVLGNAGVVTVIVTATSSFAQVRGLEVGVNVLVLMTGILVIAWIARHAPLVRRWEDFAESRLERMAIFRNASPAEELLHISDGFGVLRIEVPDGSVLVGQPARSIEQELEHASLLGLERHHHWLPRPGAEVLIEDHDRLVVYGRLEDLVRYLGPGRA